MATIELDYCLVSEPAMLVVEEFVLGADHAAVRLDSAAWSVPDRRRLPGPDVSRRMRTDGDVRERVTVVRRTGAEVAFGGPLPAEAALRSQLEQGGSLAAAPLRLGAATPAAGFRESRLYRILYANQPLRVDLGGRLDVGADRFRWELRRIGGGVAWCVDLTADLAGQGDGTVRTVIRELLAAGRAQGLIPVTVERFS